MKLYSLTLAACVALASTGVALAGGKSTPNSPSTPSAASSSAVWVTKPLGPFIAQMVASGQSGTITLENGTQIFVSVTGILVTSSSSTITAKNVYEGTSAAVAGFLAEAISDSDGEFDPNQAFTTTR